MKNFSLILLLTLALACERASGPLSGVCYTLAERQCAMDPFNSYVKDTKTLDERANGVATYLRDQDIPLSEVKSNPKYTGAVCLACTCPSEYSYRLIIPVADTAKLKILDLALAERDCD